ncbi:hypothetical protein ACSBR1_000322 [Camellia fascicularis]
MDLAVLRKKQNEDNNTTHKSFNHLELAASAPSNCLARILIHPYCIYTKSVHKNVEAAYLSLIITTSTDLPLLPTVFAQSPAQAPVSQSPLLAAQALVAQSPVPAAKAPVALSIVPPLAPSGPLNITVILEQALHFTTLIRLLKSTRLDNEIYAKLNDSSQSLTMFAPTNNAFGNLKKGNQVVEKWFGNILQILGDANDPQLVT